MKAMPSKATRSGAYVSWTKMMERCSNPNHERFKWYGGRGIRVCERWLTFDKFLEDMGQRPPGMTIDRIDVNGNYEPTNCRWATDEEQRREQRARPPKPRQPKPPKPPKPPREKRVPSGAAVGRVIEHAGLALTVRGWSERLGIPCTRLRDRLYRGEPPERAFDPSLHPRPTQGVPDGMRRCCLCRETKSLEEFYRSKHTLHGRTYTCVVCTKAVSKKRYDANRRRRELEPDNAG